MTAWLAVGAVAFLVLAVVLFRLRPRVALVAWFVVLAAVPVWVAAPHVPVLPQAVLGLLVVVAFLPHWGRLTAGDLVFGVLVVVSLVASLATWTPVDIPADVVLVWTVGYLTGRVLSARVGVDPVLRTAAVVLGIAGGLAVVEYVTRFDPFQRIVVHNALFDLWGSPNSRSGEWRAEGAFGHPIALGCSLAIGVPLALGSSLRSRSKLLVLVGLFGGAVVTFSRIALICASLGLLLSLVSRRTPLRLRTRAVVAAGVLVAAVGVVPFVLATLNSSGAVAADSADYRGWLLDLVPGIAPIGLSSLYHAYPDGTVRFGTFASIDNALLLIGLRYGAIAVAVIVVALAAAATTVLRLRASAATVALVAQIPAFVSAALITQYAVLVWVLVGVAVTSELRPFRAAPPSTSSLDDLPVPASVRHPSAPARETAAVAPSIGSGHR